MHTNLTCVPATVKKADVNLLQNLKPGKFGLVLCIKSVLYASTV